MKSKSTQYVAIYKRISTKQQSMRSQEPDLKKWEKSQDQPVVWFSDEVTGKTMNRPGWRKLEREIAKGNVSAIVVWRMDRLGRSAKELLALFDELKDKKINLISLRDNIDLQSASGRMYAGMLAVFAEYETELRAERILAGQAAARKAGKEWGGSKKGVRRAAKGKESKIIKYHQQGMLVAEIARSMELTRNTIYNVLKQAGFKFKKSKR